MAVTLLPAEGSKEYQIADSEGNTFSLFIRKPTVLEQMRDQGHLLTGWHLPERACTELTDRQTDRLLSLVEDWSGVEGADGKPVKFTQENFLMLLAQDPVLITQTMNVVDDLYRYGRSEDEVKNSESPSGTSSPDGVNLDQELQPGPDSDDSEGSQSLSD